MELRILTGLIFQGNSSLKTLANYDLKKGKEQEKNTNKTVNKAYCLNNMRRNTKRVHLQQKLTLL